MSENPQSAKRYKYGLYVMYRNNQRYLSWRESLNSDGH